MALLLLLSQFVGFAFWFTALWILLKVRYNRPFWPSLHWFLTPELAARGVSYGIALAFTVGTLGALLRVPDVNTPMREFLNDPLALALVSVLAPTLGPLFEELLFRGFLLPLLTRSLGPVLGITLTTLPFALLHGQQHNWLWQPVVLIGLAGAAFGVMRYRTGSTAASAVMHAAYNGIFVIAYHIQQRMHL
jgi:uncharacterized protein